MALFSEPKLRARASQSVPMFDSAESLVKKKLQESASINSFDIFLSHSFNDKDLILGTCLTLEDLGYKVYLDWRVDRSLSRDNVTKETAALLRTRLRQSKSLFFATTENSSSSKWMPWELGFKDGSSGKAAILPIVKGNSLDYHGQEYLGIYPYVSKEPSKTSNKDFLWINHSASCYVKFDAWLDGKEPFEHN